jgi:hypothetical protein
MSTKHGTRRSITYYMRVLHRDIGYLALGLTIVFALSGVILIYRETDFLKSPVPVEKTLPPQLSSEGLASTLRLRHFQVTQDEGEVIRFQDGTALQDGVYSRTTGTVSFVKKQFPSFIDRCIGIHKVNDSKGVHWFFVVYGVALLFLAVSSLWMFKPRTRHFRRGLLLSGSGTVLTLVLLFLV